MKKSNRFRLCLVLSFLLVFLFSCSASAAPAKVTNLKATTSKKTIKLTWTKVTGAAGYEVYRVNTGSSPTLVKKTTKNSLSISSCTYGTTYRFKVRAYDKNGKYGSYSKIVSITPDIKRAAAPKYFRMLYQGDGTATFKWQECSGVKGYVIEMYDTTKKEYVTKTTVTSGSTVKATVRNLSAGVTYKFRVRSYKMSNGKKLLSNASNVVSVKAVAMTDATKEVRNAYYVVKTKKATTATNTKTKETIKLKANTKLYVTSKTSATVKGYLTNGTPIKIKRSVLKYVGLDSSPKDDYSKATKEQFVNLKGVSSKTGYLIWISQSKCKVNIFSGSKGKWKLQKVFPCCIGKWNTRTVQGIHKILKKEPNGQYGGPVITFSSGEGTPETPEGCAFHNQVNSTMSKAVSNGCIRMVLSDLNWLNDHCALGTTVYIF